MNANAVVEGAGPVGAEDDEGFSPKEMLEALARYFGVPEVAVEAWAFMFFEVRGYDVLRIYEARDFLVSVGRWYAEDGAVHGPWPEAVPSELGPLGARAEAFFAWGKEWRPRMLAELLERQRHASVVARHAGSPSLAKVLN